MPRTTPILLIATMTTLAGASSSAWATSKGVMTEAVSDYGGVDDIPNAVPNAKGFRDRMAQGTGSSKVVILHPWENGLVYDSDFVDPDYTHNNFDSDTANFDRPGTSISYYSGHGLCTDAYGPEPFTTCMSSASCRANPVFGSSGRCQWDPMRPANGYCVHDGTHGITVYGDMSQHWNSAIYSGGSNGQMAKWGESPNSGAWFGVGTNGGANLVVLDLSFGATIPTVYHDLAWACAGVHMIATIAPVNGDNAIVANRGSAFADSFVANPNGSVPLAWQSVVSKLPGWGKPCTGGGGQGGFGGINGCGANLTFSLDVGASIGSRYNETWVQLQDDTRDVTGNQYWISQYKCNYDCNKYPILKD